MFHASLPRSGLFTTFWPNGMNVNVELIDSVDRLSEDDLRCWNQLTATPLQRWEWLGSWWEAFGGSHQLYTLKVTLGQETIGFAPWFLSNRLSTGRTIEFLGSGKACTDHLSLITKASETETVANGIAKWLVSQTDQNTLRWDAMELIGADAEDTPINQLCRSMEQYGLSVEKQEGMPCYAIALPESWDEYLKMRSKSGRREVRQSLKNIDNGTIVVSKITDEEGLGRMWHHFVQLHQRRREVSGTSGCFDFPNFESFLRKASSRLLQAGLLEFVVATADGTPVAAQLAIADRDNWHFYQSGMEPSASDLRPGLSVFCHAIRNSIDTGRKQFDMMRGDEPYKLRWRAEKTATQEIRVCSNRATAQVRNQFYKAGLTFKHLVKSGLGIAQPQ